MKPVRILPEAAQELQRTHSYYETLKSGLSHEFKAEFEAAVERISQFPEAWPRFSRRARRYVMKRFPYNILYRDLPHSVAIYAVMHMKRSPGSEEAHS